MRKLEILAIVCVSWLQKATVKIISKSTFTAGILSICVSYLPSTQRKLDNVNVTVTTMELQIQSACCCNMITVFNIASACKTCVRNSKNFRYHLLPRR